MSTNDIDTSDWLDAALEAAGREHRAAYVADEGFTAQVIGRLPVAPSLPAWRRPVIVLLWLLAGGGAVWFLPGTFENALRSGVALLIGRPPGLTDVAMLLVLCGAAAWTSLVYAARAN